MERRNSSNLEDGIPFLNLQALAFVFFVVSLSLLKFQEIPKVFRSWLLFSQLVSEIRVKKVPFLKLQRLGSGSSGELSPASIQSLQEAGNQDVGSSATKPREHMSKSAGSDMESSSKRSDASRTRGREIGTNSRDDMPCVFTKGDGPNGRRVDGILYKYGKGEEVRIMCVCHGSFHSPAEFVKHAGGTDVDNPLKHIVVNPNSSSLL